MKKFFITIVILTLINFSNSADCKCKFIEYTDGYNCLMTTSFREKVEVTKIIGDHLEGKTSSDVESIYVIYSSTTKYIPSQFCQHFDNLERFDINGGLIIEFTKDILDGCSKLNSIALRSSKINYLEPNLLENLSSLEYFILSSTKVEYLPKNFFTKNLNLKRVELFSNKLEIINAEFPSTLTALSVLQNGCNVNKQFNKNDLRSPSLESVVNDVKQNCNNLTDNSLELTTLKSDSSTEQKINEIENEMSFVISSFGEVIFNYLYLEGLRMKQIIFSNKIIQNDQSLNLTSENIEKVKGEIQKIDEIFLKLKLFETENVKNLKAFEGSLEDIEELEEEIENLRILVTENESMMIVVFVILLVFSVVATFLTINVKNLTKMC